MNKIIFFVGLFCAVFAQAGDMGFRYKNGQCVNAQGVVGLNPSYFGQCADLKGSSLGNLHLDGVDFSGAHFDNANLDKTTLIGSNLFDVSFENANLAGVQFASSTIQKTNFRGANLKNCSFFENPITASDFTGAHFLNSQLSDIKFEDSQFKGATFSAVQMDGADFSKNQMAATDFSNVTVNTISFAGSVLTGAKFMGAKILNANFDNVAAEKCDMTNAVLTGASFLDAKLDGCTFHDASLGGAKMDGAHLESGDLRGTDLTGVALERVQLKTTRFSRRTVFSYTQEQATALGMIFIKLYEFQGLKMNLKIADLDGWTMCHLSVYGSGDNPIDKIIQDCGQNNVMLACRLKGSDTLILAAYGSHDKVFMDIGQSNVGTLDNGVKFYFSREFSMGFTSADLQLNRNSCDYKGDKPEQRLCFHTTNNSIVGGYRCGDNDLNDSQDYERLLLRANS